MAIEVRFCTSAEEFRKASGPIFHYFGGPLPPEDMERSLQVFEVERTQMALDGDEVVGGAGAHTYELTVPGGLVPAAGVTIVGVNPMHRRRGILSSMMRTQLDDVHRRGEPVAYLWASEETIYGRFGYGMASWAGQIELPKASSAFSRSFTPRSQIRFVEETDAYEPIARLYDRVRGDYPGMFSRKESWWKLRRLYDSPARRAGGGVMNRVLLTIDGEVQGYALYRIHASLEAGISSSMVGVIEAIGATPEATRDLWRFLLDIDWTTKVKCYNLPIDHPLFLLLANPRQTRLTLGDGLWVRLVDVPAALRARRYQQSEAVVIEVKDTFCPWNDGRYRVAADGVEKTDAGANLRLDVDALGSVYLGGFRFSGLLEAGRVVEVTPRAAAAADRLFAVDRAPWCPEIF